MSVSKYFSQQNKPETDDLADCFINLENDLVSQLNKLNYGPDVVYIYSPLDYAFNLHKIFLKKFLNTNKKVLFLGINPGPWGMCQTGIPFGEVNIVRSYLRVVGEVLTPTNYHPQRPVTGLDCHRSESKYQKELQEICDKSLSDIVTLLHIDTIVAIGKYAEKRSNEVVKNFKLNNIKVVQIPHPSPRSVGTAEKWKNETLDLLKSNNILQLFK